MDSIPYAKIADIDFSKPKSTIAPMKRGAHCNNDREMLSDPSEIEVNSSNPSSRGQRITGSLNPNMPLSMKQLCFFDNAASHNPAVLSLLSPYCNSYVPVGSDDDVPFDIPSLYKADNEELTYKELLGVGEEVVFELSEDQICLIEQHTRAQYGCDL